MHRALSLTYILAEDSGKLVVTMKHDKGCAGGLLGFNRSTGGVHPTQTWGTGAIRGGFLEKVTG